MFIITATDLPVSLSHVAEGKPESIKQLWFVLTEPDRSGSLSQTTHTVTIPSKLRSAEQQMETHGSK